jgi:hypothetical protein
VDIHVRILASVDRAPVPGDENKLRSWTPKGRAANYRTEGSGKCPRVLNPDKRTGARRFRASPAVPSTVG